LDNCHTSANWLLVSKVSQDSRPTWRMTSIRPSALASVATHQAINPLPCHSPTCFLPTVGLGMILSSALLQLRSFCSCEQVTVAYNPSYSGARDLQDLGSKSTQASSSQEPISKNTQHEKGLVKLLTW
jgi:hypothetical protein